MATTTKKTVSADSSNPLHTLVNLWPYMWPSDRPDLKMRVVWASLFLLASKIVLLPLKMSAQNRIRTEGYDAVLAAAKAAGVRRYLAQSAAFSLPGASGRAVASLEAATLGYPGVVLRYGYFYGPGTWSAKPGKAPRVHVEHAAQRTVELLDAEPGVYEVVDPA